jgi:hypothetical protein
MFASGRAQFGASQPDSNTQSSSIGHGRWFPGGSVFEKRSGTPLLSPDFGHGPFVHQSANSGGHPRDTGHETQQTGRFLTQDRAERAAMW